MRLLLIIIAVTVLNKTSFSQGSWDIDYVYADSIRSDLVGKLVRIDFRHSKDAAKPTNWIRSIISWSDTGFVRIGTELIVFREKRELYVDHGSFKDQYLVSANVHKKPFSLFDAEVLSVTGDQINFKFFTSNTTTGAALLGSVNINQLDGLLIMAK